MAVSLDTENLKFTFKLIKISDANYEIFSSSHDPEVMMLGVLANFGEHETNQVIKSIVKGIRYSGKNQAVISKYFKQLRILVQLRTSLISQIDKAMISVSTFFKEEDDFLYRRGERKGETKAKEMFIKNLLLNFDFSDEIIAEMAEADLVEVTRIHKELGQE